jgi:hypothetical protein
MDGPPYFCPHCGAECEPDHKGDWKIWKCPVDDVAHTFAYQMFTGEGLLN